MRFLVVDDENPSRRELVHLIKEELDNVEIDEADSGVASIELLNKNEYDGAFVDIRLGDMEGTKLAMTMQKMQPSIKIVFATAYSDYAVKAFDLNAVDYLMKPFDPQRVSEAIDKLIEAINEYAASDLESQLDKEAPFGFPDTITKDKLPINVDKSIVFIKIDDITFIESKGKECLIHTEKTTYTTNLPLYHFEEKLVNRNFFRAHRSFLVNLDYVYTVEPWFNGAFCIKLKNNSDDSVPVSRNQMRVLRDALGF